MLIPRENQYNELKFNESVVVEDTQEPLSTSINVSASVGRFTDAPVAYKKRSPARKQPKNGAATTSFTSDKKELHK